MTAKGCYFDILPFNIQQKIYRIVHNDIYVKVFQELAHNVRYRRFDPFTAIRYVNKQKCTLPTMQKRDFIFKNDFGVNHIGEIVTLTSYFVDKEDKFLKIHTTHMGKWEVDFSRPLEDGWP